MSAYRRFNPKKDPWSGSGVAGYIDASFDALAKVLGPPMRSEASTGRDGDGKVSTAWRLVDPATGQQFTVYEYKATRAYAGDNPSIKAFRSLSSYRWHIGANVDPRAFGEWLAKMTGGRFVSTEQYHREMKIEMEAWRKKHLGRAGGSERAVRVVKISGLSRGAARVDAAAIANLKESRDRFIQLGQRAEAAAINDAIYAEERGIDTRDWALPAFTERVGLAKGTSKGRVDRAKSRSDRVVVKKR